MSEQVAINSFAITAAFLLFLEFSYSSKARFEITRTIMQLTNFISRASYSKQKVAKKIVTAKGTNIFKTAFVAG